MSELPLPLTPPDCNLSDFQYMELDVRRLRDSKFAAGVDAEAFRAGILLWCAAWHQIPAASLPDDDIELANLAGYGRVLKEWKKVKNDALHGFIKCSDGRLYHPVIAGKAVAAYAAKERHAFEKFKERLRKENAARKAEGKNPFGIPSLAQWKSGNYPHGIPPEFERIPPENSTPSEGNTAENALKGNREGKEQRGNREGEGEGDLLKPSVPTGTGAQGARSADELTKDELWKSGKSLLEAAGLPKAQCGSFVGKLVKDYGNDIVIDAVRAAVMERPADPVEYLKAVCMRAKGQRSTPNRQEALEQRNLGIAAKLAGEAA